MSNDQHRTWTIEIRQGAPAATPGGAVLAIAAAVGVVLTLPFMLGGSAAAMGIAVTLTLVSAASATQSWKRSDRPPVATVDDERISTEAWTLPLDAINHVELRAHPTGTMLVAFARTLVLHGPHRPYELTLDGVDNAGASEIARRLAQQAGAELELDVTPEDHLIRAAPLIYTDPPPDSLEARVDPHGIRVADYDLEIDVDYLRHGEVRIPLADVLCSVANPGTGDTKPHVLLLWPGGVHTLYTDGVWGGGDERAEWLAAAIASAAHRAKAAPPEDPTVDERLERERIEREAADLMRRTSKRETS